MTPTSDVSHITVAAGPLGEEGRWLLGAISFGTSMLPFFQPQDEIWHEKVEPSRLRLGDVITLRTQANQLVTHRVVKIVGRDGQRSFLTKGDNCLTLDPVVSGDQVVGRVTRCGGRDLTGGGWRRLGALLAWVSYRQAMLYRLLARSRLNALRHALERRGWCPKVRLLGGYRVLSSPASCLTWARAAGQSVETRRQRGALRSQGIRVRTWQAGDVERMSQLWNASFPSHPTTPERLDRMVCRCPWFDPSGCFILERAGDFLGWGFATLHQCQPARRGRFGFIEFLALTEAGWKLRGDLILFHESFAWLKKRGVSEISLGPLLTEQDPLGIALTPALTAAAVQGFTLSHRSDEQVVTRKGYRPPAAGGSMPGLAVRPLRASDEDLAAADDLFRRNGSAHFSAMVRGSLAPEGGEDRFRVAVLDGQLVGLCRQIPDAQLRDYRDLGYVWAASRPGALTGYFTHFLVDAAHRSQGIGTALAGQAVEEFFKAGCEEVNLWGARSELYRRLGFTKRAHFIRMRLQR